MPFYGTLIICIGIVVLTANILSKRAEGRPRKKIRLSTPSPQPAAASPQPQQPTNKEGWLQKLPVGGILLVVLTICLGMVGFYFWTRSNKETRQTATVTSRENAPEEVILREIAKCESGGQQFRDNVVVRNTNGTGDPSDDDIGELQINLKHQAAIIKELGANVFDREDNYRVAREILRRQGTGPWNKSRACWAPKLIALGISPDGKGSGVPSPRIEEVVAENGEWSPVVNNDRRFEKVRWYPNKKEDCEIRADEDDTKVFGCDQVLDLNAVPKTFSFRHKGKEPMTVEVRFTDPFTR